MSDYLQPPDWKAVRSIYKKLSEEFHVLTNAYQLVIDPRIKLMLDHLILGIDKIDHYVDELPTEKERNQLTNGILDFFNNIEKSFDPTGNYPESLNAIVRTLKRMVHELKVEERFYEASAKIFDFTERKRHTLNTQELIDLVKLEGQATAELPLSILQIPAEQPFGQFFARLCMLMGIADLIIDARSDFKAKFIAVRPSLGLYLKLNSILIREGLKLIWKFPRKWSFLIYCIKFTTLLAFSKD